MDLVKGDHITLFFTEGEALQALQDYEGAKRGGVDLTDVKFLDRQAMLEVRVVFSTCPANHFHLSVSCRHMESTTLAFSSPLTISGLSNSFRPSTTSRPLLNRP